MKEYNNTPLVLALGFFDGVHLGHQKLIELANNLAKEKGIDSGVMSFKKHPLTEIFPRYAPLLLMSNDEKREKILGLGTDFVFLEDFDENLMKYSPEKFVKDFLLEKFNIDTLIVGYNYSFGYKGEGKAEDLIELGKKYGFDVKVVKPILVKEDTVSSTGIRDLLSAGDVEEVEKRLGHPYRISGKIREGKKLGRQFEIPTANLDYDERRLLPKNGVYFTHVIIDGKVYDGLTNLGYNPTFTEHPYAIETYIYDFDGDLYGKEVGLEFLKYIRGDIKFSSLDELFGRIKSDIDEVDRLYRKKEDS